MSYDIDLRLPEYGPSADRSVLEQLEGAAVSSEERARNRRLAFLLQAQSPGLEVFESDTVLELTDPASGNGIQITLFAKSGAITMPYWHDSDAPKLLAQVSKYLRLLHDEGGFIAYDPQTDREVTAETGYSLDPAVYAVGVRAVRNLAPKPWWRFW